MIHVIAMIHEHCDIWSTWSMISAIAMVNNVMIYMIAMMHVLYHSFDLWSLSNLWPLTYLLYHRCDLWPMICVVATFQSIAFMPLYAHTHTRTKERAYQHVALVSIHTFASLNMKDHTSIWDSANSRIATISIHGKNPSSAVLKASL